MKVASPGWYCLFFGHGFRAPPLSLSELTCLPAGSLPDLNVPGGSFLNPPQACDKGANAFTMSNIDHRESTELMGEPTTVDGSHHNAAASGDDGLVP